MRHIRFFILILQIVLSHFTTAKQIPTESMILVQEANKAIEVEQEIPMDPSVTYGKLDNGFTYYIRRNEKPENRIELRLVINAGSILEDDDQQGLAHFVEHMAFNGTKNFAKQELVNYLESVGMRFGPELNAYTTFDETVYMLRIPADSLPVLETGMQILKDWSQYISFDDDEVDKERGVVIEEWRLGRGAEARMRDKQLPILFNNSKYAERLPIGKKAVLETFRHEILHQFFSDWYRPDLMAVIVVGDIDANLIKNKIQQYFSDIRSHANPRPRIVYPVPDHKKTLFAIATDKEATRTSVGLYTKLDIDTIRTFKDYRSYLLERLYNSALNERLAELTKQADPPFIYAYSTKGRLIRSKEVYILATGVKDDGILRGFETLMTEAERVRRHGFTESELERHKKALLRAMELAYDERDKTESRQFAAEYVRHFLSGEPIPGIQYEYDFFKQNLPSITLEEVDELASHWLIDESRVVMISAPEKNADLIPDEQELLQLLDKVEAADIEPYYDIVSDQPLLSTKLTPAEVVSEKTLDSLNILEWKLANGVKVILKTTNFKNDEILFSAFSPGGTSLASDADYIAAMTAPFIIEEAGLGDFSATELEKKLAGKAVSVSPYLSELYEGLSGGGSPKDIEVLFQLIYLYFTAPREDSAAYASLHSRLQSVIKNRSARPESAFQDTIQVTLAQYHPRSRPMTESLLNEMNLQASMDFFKKRFADASDFTFIFVGNLDLDQIKEYAETYLSTLPTQQLRESWRNISMNPPIGIITKTLHKGMEPKSMVALIFSGPFEWSQDNRYDFQSTIDVLRIKFREILREEQSGTYGVNISGSVNKFPDEEYQINIFFGCAPENADNLINTVFQQLDSLKTFGPDSVYISKVREMHKRERETDLKENRFWLSALRQYYMHDESPRQLLRFDQLVQRLSAETVRNAALHYFNENNYIRVILYPENFNSQPDEGSHD